MVGNLEIIALREEAEDALGSAFDLREFHDVVLRNGPIPLSILRDEVRSWLEWKAVEGAAPAEAAPASTARASGIS